MIIKKIAQHLLLLLVLIAVELPIAKAQVTADQDTLGIPDTLALEFYETPDSFFTNTFVPGDLNSLTTVNDSSIFDNRFHYNPARENAYDLMNLGNLGSAAYPLYWHRRKKVGFDLGYHAYDAYKIDPDSFRYFDLNNVYTSLSYTQGLSQNDRMTEVEFSKNFKERINLTFDYRRINNEGIYNNQRNLHTILGLGFWYRSENERFNSFLTFFSNSFNAEDNGGIVEGQQLNDPNLARRNSLKVNTPDASTRHQTRGVSLNNYLRVGKDSSKLTLQYRIRFQRDLVKFADEVYNPAHYKDFAIDDRGQRFFVSSDEIRNELYLGTVLDKAGYRFWRVGIRSSFFSIDRDGPSDSFEELFLHAAYTNWFAERWLIEGEINYDILNPGSQFSWRAGLSFARSKNRRIGAEVHFLKHKNTYIQQTLYLQEVEIWKTDYPEPSETDIRIVARWTDKRIVAALGIAQNKNLIYFDTTFRPALLPEAEVSPYIYFQKNFRTSNFSFDNQIIVHLNTRTEQQLPDWYSKHSIYYVSRLFSKVLEMRSGFDVRYMPQYPIPGYMALTGQYYHIGRSNYYLPLVDFHLGFHVQRFIAFIRLENLTQLLLEGKDSYFFTKDHPMFDLGFRFGFKWSFTD